MSPPPTAHKSPSLPEILWGRRQALNDGALWFCLDRVNPL